METFTGQHLRPWCSAQVGRPVAPHGLPAVFPVPEATGCTPAVRRVHFAHTHIRKNCYRLNAEAAGSVMAVVVVVVVVLTCSVVRKHQAASAKVVPLGT